MSSLSTLLALPVFTEKTIVNISVIQCLPPIKPKSEHADLKMTSLLLNDKPNLEHLLHGYSAKGILNVCWNHRNIFIETSDESIKSKIEELNAKNICLLKEGKTTDNDAYFFMTDYAENMSKIIYSDFQQSTKIVMSEIATVWKHTNYDSDSKLSEKHIDEINSSDIIVFGFGCFGGSTDLHSDNAIERIKEILNTTLNSDKPVYIFVDETVIKEKRYNELNSRLVHLDSKFKVRYGSFEETSRIYVMQEFLRNRQCYQKQGFVIGLKNLRNNIMSAARKDDVPTGVPF